jgi:hypothetical protein
MPNKTDFTLFLLLSVEIRLLIWELSLQPQILNLVPEAYSYMGDATAIRYSLLDNDPSIEPPYGNPNEVAYARFTMPNANSPTAFQVSHESRFLALSRGYRSLKVYNRQGQTRIII